MNCIQPSAPGGGHVQVAAVVGLDLVDRRQDLPADAVLDPGRLIDRQQERRHPELANDEVRHPARRRRPRQSIHKPRIRRGRRSVGAAQRLRPGAVRPLGRELPVVLDPAGPRAAATLRARHAPVVGLRLKLRPRSRVVARRPRAGPTGRVGRHAGGRIGLGLLPGRRRLARRRLGRGRRLRGRGRLARGLLGGRLRRSGRRLGRRRRRLLDRQRLERHRRALDARQLPDRLERRALRELDDHGLERTVGELDRDAVGLGRGGDREDGGGGEGRRRRRWPGAAPRRARFEARTGSSVDRKVAFPGR